MVPVYYVHAWSVDRIGWTVLVFMSVSWGYYSLTVSKRQTERIKVRTNVRLTRRMTKVNKLTAWFPSFVIGAVRRMRAHLTAGRVRADRSRLPRKMQSFTHPRQSPWCDSQFSFSRSHTWLKQGIVSSRVHWGGRYGWIHISPQSPQHDLMSAEVVLVNGF